MEAKNFASAKMQRLVPNNHGNRSRTWSAIEKNNFLNTQDIDLIFIYVTISPKLQYYVEEESLSTPSELWTRLEVLFENKEGCEDCMQKIDKIEPAGKSPEDQAS